MSSIATCEESVGKEGALYNFANETTLHGLPKIIKPSNIYKRSVWFVLFSCSLAVLIWQAFQLVNQFLSFKTTVSVNVDQEPIQFPAVTICNENGANMETREDIARHISGYNLIDSFKRPNYSVFSDLNIDKGNGSECSTHECEFKQAYLDWFSNIVKVLQTNLKDSHHLDGYVLAANLGLNFSTSAGLRIENSVYVCTIGEIGCGKKISFAPYPHPKHLLCHTLNSKLKAQVGRSQGLKLVLKYQPVTPLLEELNLMPGLSRADVSPGFRISVHPPDTPPSLDDNGIIFYPGVRSSLAFTKTMYHRLRKPYGKCSTDATLRNTGIPYSEKGCMDEYKQEVTRELCNCTDISLPHKEDDVNRYPFCRKLAPPNECSYNASFWSRINKMKPETYKYIAAECLEELRKFNDRYSCLVKASNLAYTRITKGDLDIQCYPPCRQVKYEIQETDSVWPSSDGFYQTLADILIENDNNKQEIADMFGGNSKQSILKDFRSKFLQVNVYLKDADVITNTEEPLYEWYQMLSELGGLVGLYIGMSLMTLCEILELLLMKLCGFVYSYWSTTKCAGKKTKVEAIG